MDSQRTQPRRKPSKVKQACDCCHTRKIRCDGNEPCTNCQATDLRCTYLTVPKKKGPKGPRTGKSSAAYRKTRENVLNGDSSANILPPIVPHLIDGSRVSDDGPFSRGSSFEPSPLISSDIIRRCLDGFFAHKYPIMPILNQEQTYASLHNLHELPEQYGLITALCAMIILQPEILGPPTQSEDLDIVQLPSSEFFVAETHRSRQFCNHVEIPSLATVQTSFFLFAASFSIRKDNSAWFYIREAMTMLQLQRFHEEDTYSKFSDYQHATYCRRTFWLLFITERAYALQRHRPLTLQRTINLPTVKPGPEATILSGFLDLVSLFQNFDDNFLSLWNLSSVDSPASPQSLIRLQDILKFALPDVSDRTEIQQADLLISKHWLKTMVWQLCVTKGLLSSTTTNESMSFRYPVTIARDVVLVSRLLPPKAFEANGVGILEKVFDIGCSLADVLLLQPNAMQAPSFEIGPRDYLMELMRILGTVLGGNSRYLRLLAAKANECLHVRIRGSLSESESSGEMTVIEEIEDVDDENYTPVDLERSNFGPYAVTHNVDFALMGNPPSPYVIQHSKDTRPFSPTNFANERHNSHFSPSTDEWNRIAEAEVEASRLS